MLCDGREKGADLNGKAMIREVVEIQSGGAGQVLKLLKRTGSERLSMDGYICWL